MSNQDKLPFVVASESYKEQQFVPFHTPGHKIGVEAPQLLKNWMGPALSYDLGVMYALDDIGIETVKCKQLEGENGCARATLVDGDRVFLGSNEGGIRGKTPYVVDRFDLEYIRQFDFVHSGNYCFMEKELPKIHEAGVPISFDFSDDSEDS